MDKQLIPKIRSRNKLYNIGPLVQSLRGQERDGHRDNDEEKETKRDIQTEIL
jgi:hypothetical protein